MTVDTAISGDVAIKRVKDRLEKHKYYKLIFMDIEMTGMDGIETAKEITKFIPEQKVIACSGYSLS